MGCVLGYNFSNARVPCGPLERCQSNDRSWIDPLLKIGSSVLSLKEAYFTHRNLYHDRWKDVAKSNGSVVAYEDNTNPAREAEDLSHHASCERYTRR